MNYTMFLDPFPGYWDTMMFNPEWGVNFIAENVAKWKYNDALEYAGGKIQFYIYDTKANSTSYAVELGELQSEHDINSDRLSIHYYSYGEPSLPRMNRRSEFCCMDDLPAEKRPIAFLRVDSLGNDTEDIDGWEDLRTFDFISSGVLSETGWVQTSTNRKTAIMGVCPHR